MDLMNLAEKRCVPCEGTTSSLTDNVEDEFLKETPAWQIDRTTIHKLDRRFTFKSFIWAIGFVNRIACITENEQHHPDFRISYKKVSIELWTHAINGLSENDFILAAKIDTIAEQENELCISPDWSI